MDAGQSGDTAQRITTSKRRLQRRVTPLEVLQEPIQAGMRKVFDLRRFLIVIGLTVGVMLLPTPEGLTPEAQRGDCSLRVHRQHSCAGAGSPADCGVDGADLPDRAGHRHGHGGVCSLRIAGALPDPGQPVPGRGLAQARADAAHGVVHHRGQPGQHGQAAVRSDVRDGIVEHVGAEHGDGGCVDSGGDYDCSACTAAGEGAARAPVAGSWHCVQLQHRRHGHVMGSGENAIAGGLLRTGGRLRISVVDDCTACRLCSC